MAENKNIVHVEPASPAAKGMPIYAELAQHQQVESWFGQQLMLTLQEWGDRFNVVFKLDVPEFVIRIDYLSRACYGHFRYGHNGLGLRGEIALNARYLDGQRDHWAMLGTLLHELLHGWQQAHGKPGEGNYHNAEFRDKAGDFGLIIDRRGVTQYEFDSKFTRLLGQHGVHVPQVEASSEEGDDIPNTLILPGQKRIKGKSKLKKWTCACGTNIRCAVPNLYAQCLHCGQVFQLQV